MSCRQLALCSSILNDYYGNIVEKVAVCLAQSGVSNIRTVIKKTGLSVKEVKEALTVLILQNIAVFEVSEKPGSPVEYSVSVDKILKRTRFEKYAYCARKLCGDVAQVIIEELLLHGQASQKRLIDLSVEKLNHNLQDGDQPYAASKVREIFTSLVQLHFIGQRKSQSVGNSERSFSAVSSNTGTASDTTGAKRKRALDDSIDETPASKRLRADSPVNMPATDLDRVLWRVDFDGIESHLRDQMIVEAISNRIGKNAGEVIATMLKLSRLKSPPDCTATYRVSSHDILDELSVESKTSRENYSQWLKILSGDASSFVMREEGAGGGMYYINFRTSFTTLALAHIESVVTERFGLKARRIFHLIYTKKHVEQKQIEILSMIRPKDAKELLYCMLEENFVSLTEVPKGTEYVPGKVIYLFSINLPQIARMLIEKSYRGMANMICRRNHHFSENAQLLQQKTVLDAYVSRLEAQGEEESVIEMVKEQITPAERKQLDFIDSMTYRLDQASIQADETLFLLETYLKYVYMKT